MKTYLSLFLVLMFAASASRAQEMVDPETWYRDVYAPLWSNSPGDNIPALLKQYAMVIVTHEDGGEISRDTQEAWLAEPMREWLADGWLGAELVQLQTQRINASTAAFTASWIDSYEGGETESSCGWYLADAMDGRWIFTAYADTPCAD